MKKDQEKEMKEEIEESLDEEATERDSTGELSKHPSSKYK